MTSRAPLVALCRGGMRVDSRLLRLTLLAGLTHPLRTLVLAVG